MVNILWQSVFHQHASLNTRFHCLYGFFFLGLSRKELAHIYGKHKSTISEWISAYNRNDSLTKSERKIVYKKFGIQKRQWLINLYIKEPVLFLDEAQKKFVSHFAMPISRSSIVRILHTAGMSWKVIERRAIQIRHDEIKRYYRELTCFNWDLHQLVFLDEVSFDSRDMLRNRGYGFVGKKLIFKGEFRRRPRVSSLCFLGQKGILDSFMTKGTFTRKLFFQCCRTFALENHGVQQFPGFNSVWVMDGARIHCDKHIVMYLRSLGIIPIFLPPYCPFYNPIEILFGIVKKYLKRHYQENDTTDIRAVVGDALIYFKTYDCTGFFHRCGYTEGGIFSPEVGLSQQPSSLGFD